MATEKAHQARVYRYAIWGDLPPSAIAEMRRGHELLNRLVEIEKGYEESVKEVWRQAPTLLALENQALEFDERVQDTVKEIARYRQRNRTTDAGAELKAKLKANRKDLRETKKKIREEKDRIYPILKPDLARLGSERNVAIKATYRPAVDGGLY
jgi:hypothetical protein